MIELRAFNNAINIRELYINNINNVIVSNYKTLYEFLNLFFNSENKLFIGNNKIDNKTSHIINLLDYESISNQLTLKKGTILYDYLINELNEKTELTDIKEEIDSKLRQLINSAIDEKSIEYDFSFDIDLGKIITNYVSFDIDLSIDSYIQIIRKLIYNLKTKNPKKIIVILLNTKIFDNELDDLRDIYIFKFNSQNFPNILISDSIVNVDKNLLLNQLILNWPSKISESELINIINAFMASYITSNNTVISDINMYIGFKLISKILNLKCECRYQSNSNNNLPEIYKNYINSL